MINDLLEAAEILANEGFHELADAVLHYAKGSETEWTKPNKAMPPLHTQVLVALKEGAGGSGEVLDVACYVGKQVEGDATVDRWIGTGNRLETRQIAGWMALYTMSEVARLHRKLEQFETAAEESRLRGEREVQDMRDLGWLVDARDSDTHPKDGDVKQAPLVSGAAIAQTGSGISEGNG